MKVLLVIVGCSVGLLALWATAGDMTEDDRQLTRHILQVRDTPVPAGNLHPGQWDYVCYIDSYSFSADALKKRLPVTITNLDFSPEDRWVDEGRWGLAFVTTRTARARVFLIDDQAIYRIEGPECAMRETATFQVDTVVALNKTYTRLTVAGAPR